jgi:apolipoprotein D and lipocalin family protein
MPGLAGEAEPPRNCIEPCMTTEAMLMNRLRAISAAAPRPTWTLLTLVLLLAAPALRAQSVTAVPQLDQTKIPGTWYQIARLPDKREKKCVANALELIAPGDKKNQLSLVDSCSTKAGYPDVRNYSARPADKNGDGKYKVTTIWPLSRKYWFLSIGPSYDWIVIGTPNHRNLWIFAKSRTVSSQVLDTMKAAAAAQGFDTAKLHLSVQSNPGS